MGKMKGKNGKRSKFRIKKTDINFTAITNGITIIIYIVLIFIENNS